MNLRPSACAVALAMATLPTAALAVLPSAPGKLDARLSKIAAVAAAGRAEPVMAQALTRQLFRRNTPLQVRWNASGAVQVYLHFDKYGNAPSAAAMEALGATDVVVSRSLGVVQAWIPAHNLAQAAALANVSRVTVPHYAAVKRAPPLAALPRTGSVDTQGDQILGAQQFRQLTGYTGQGVTVGVISDGDDHIATAQGTGDLPASLWNDPNDAGSFKSSGDEGTAMMEIVYDLAPGVQLGFCGPQTTVDFVTCLDDFAAHFGNSRLVIVDDLGFPGVAMFTDGAFASAVKNFSTANLSVRLVTAAGNDGEGFWSGTWAPIGLPAASVNGGKPITINGVAYSQIQNFGSNAAPVTRLTTGVAAGDTLTWLVEWGDTWADSVNGLPPTGVANDPNDYDVIVTDSSGNVLGCNIGINVGAASTPPSPTSCSYSGTAGSTNTPGPQPVQGNAWTNSGSSPVTVYLEILYAAGDGNPDPHIKVLLSAANHQINLQPSTAAGSIYGQSALPYPYEITTGAVSAQDTQTIEPYSSQGPVFFFQPATGPSTRMKPDFVGVDCVTTTGAGGFTEPFCGTSAAAPHIAGLIALFESGYPSADPYAMLKAGATALGTGSPNGVYGYGLPNAMRSAAAQYPSPTAVISSPGSNATVTPKQTLNFAGSCVAGGAPGTMSYDWNFGANSGIPDSTSLNPSVAYATNGQYTVTLTCTNAFGTSGRASLAITVGSSSKSGGGGGLGLPGLALLLLIEAVRMRRRRAA